MKRYRHFNTIKLRKPNILYVNTTDGRVVKVDDIFWYKDDKIKYCLIRKYGSINCDRYTTDEFHKSFKPMVDRFRELKEETNKSKIRGPYNG